MFVALIEYILRVWSNIRVKTLIYTGEIDNCSLKDGNQWEITTVTLENGKSIYIRSKDEAEPLLRAEKKDIYAKNKQNNEYETAPSQFC